MIKQKYRIMIAGIFGIALFLYILYAVFFTFSLRRCITVFVLTCLSFFAGAFVILMNDTEVGRTTNSGVTCYILTIIYIIAQVRFSVYCYALVAPLKLQIFISLLFAGIYASSIILCLIVKGHTNDLHKDIQRRQKNVKQMRLLSEQMYMTAADAGVKKQVKRIYEKLKYSDPMTSGREFSIQEEEIITLLEQLSVKIKAGAKADDISADTAEILAKIDIRNADISSAK